MTWQQLVVYATELELANKNIARDDTSDIWLSRTATTVPDNSLKSTPQQQSPLPARHIRWSPQLQSSSCSNTVDDRANLAREQPICEFCGRVNHLWEDCWRRLQRCLRCGSAEHSIANCPRYYYHGGYQGGNPNTIPIPISYGVPRPLLRPPATYPYAGGSGPRAPPRSPPPSRWSQPASNTSGTSITTTSIGGQRTPLNL